MEQKVQDDQQQQEKIVVLNLEEQNQIKSIFSEYVNQSLEFLKGTNLQQLLLIDLHKQISEMQMKAEQKLQVFAGNDPKKYLLTQKKFEKSYKSMSNPFYSITMLLQRTLKKLIRLYLKKIEHNQAPDKQLILEEIDLFINEESLMYPKLKQQENDIKRLIFRDAQLFLYSLTQVPAVYINFFENNDFLEKLEETEIIEDELDLDLCKRALYAKLIYQLKVQIKDSEFLIDLIQDQLITFIEIMNQKISQIYNQLRDQILLMICDFNKATKDLSFNNKYFIIGLMKDLSQKLFRYAEDQLEQTFFILIDPDLRENFAKFIIEKHDVLSLSHRHQLKTISTIYEGEEDLLEEQSTISNISKIDDKKESLSSSSNNYCQFPLKRKNVIIEHQGEQQNPDEVEGNEESNTLIQKSSQVQDKPNQIQRQIMNITDDNSGSKIYTEEQKAAMEKQEKREELAYKLGLIAKNGDLEHLKLTKIVRDDGHTGILVENDRKQQFIVHKNPYGKVIMVNSKFVSRQWKIYGQQLINDKIGMITNGMDTKGLESYISKVEQQQTMALLTKQQIALMNTAAGSLGSSLGSCLANINKYESAGAFIQDFGSKAVVGGSMTYIISAVPLFGTLMMAGGLGYTTLKLYQNSTANVQTKMKQVGKVALGTTSSVGGSISGAIVGEIMIPVPVVGALIGGLIGGFLGSKATNSMFKYIEKKHYVELFNKLLRSIEEQGYWKYSKQVVKIYGVSSKFFLGSIPQELKKLVEKKSGDQVLGEEEINNQVNDIWITMISYSFITIFISEQEAKEYQKLKEERAKLRKKEKEEKAKLEKQMKKKGGKAKGGDFKDNDKDQKENKDQSEKEEAKDLSEQGSLIDSDQQQKLGENNKSQIKKQDDNEQGSSDDTDDGMEADQLQNAGGQKNQWPLYIELPQKWLKSKNVYLFDYLEAINKFINKYLNDACN